MLLMVEGVVYGGMDYFPVFALDTQPDDHAGQADVRRSTTIPVASGEREFTRFELRKGRWTRAGWQSY
jgi:hypothetical protein